MRKQMAMNHHASASLGGGGVSGGGFRNVVPGIQTTPPASSSLSLARAAMREHGVLRGLWLPGLEATCYRAFSYTGFRIGLYPTVRDAIVGSGTLGDADSIPARIAAGAATGMVGSAVFNPIDVVRIRMQGPNPYPSTLGGASESSTTYMVS